MKTARPPNMRREATMSIGRYGVTVIKRPNISSPMMEPMRPIAERNPNAVEL